MGCIRRGQRALLLNSVNLAPLPSVLTHCTQYYLTPTFEMGSYEVPVVLKLIIKQRMTLILLPLPPES